MLDEPNDVQRDLAEDLTSEQRRPGVHPAGAFADFIDVTGGDERNLQLVGERRRQNGAHEDSLYT